MPDERYLIFTHSSPSMGGMNDMEESRKTIEQAVHWLKSDYNTLRDMKGSSHCVYDRVKGEKVNLEKFGL